MDWINRFLTRMTNFRSGSDMFWAALVALNLVFFISALMSGNVVGMAINGVILAIMLRGV